MTTIGRIINELEKLANAPDLPGTAKIVAAAFAEEGIPALYCGGFALHAYGVRRPTEDVDFIVPGEYKGKLDDLLWRVLKPTHPGATIKFTCKQTGVSVDVIYAGQKMGPKLHLPPPVPHVVTKTPTPVTVEQLITMKLDSHQSSPMHRSKDRTDVIDLIKAQSLPRDLDLPEPIRPMYLDIWDALDAEPVPEETY